MRSQGRYCTPLLLMLAAASSAKQTVNGTDELDTLDEADEAENRIIGGRQAARNQFPYQAAITTAANGYSCGGSLVNQRWVLTAAHCVQGQQRVGALLGTNNWRNPGPGSHFSWADRIHTHPLAGPGRGNGHDLALLRLQNPPPINNQIRPVGLPRDDQGPTRHQGQLGTLTGWGAVQHGGGNQQPDLKFGQLPIQSGQQCSQGDSGGPFVHNGRQLGVQSFVWGDCQRGFPTGMVNVGSHLPWINQHIGAQGNMQAPQQPQAQQPPAQGQQQQQQWQQQWQQNWQQQWQQNWQKQWQQNWQQQWQQNWQQQWRQQHMQGQQMEQQ